METHLYPCLGWLEMGGHLKYGVVVNKIVIRHKDEHPGNFQIQCKALH